MKRPPSYLLGAILIIVSILSTQAQSLTVSKVVVKEKSNGVFTMKLVLKSQHKGDYIISRNQNKRYRNFSESNCNNDSIDFMFSYAGVRRERFVPDTNNVTLQNFPNVRANFHYEYMLLERTHKRKVKYIYTYKATCDKSIFYVVRSQRLQGKAYKYVVELNRFIKNPEVKIVPIDDITW